MPSLRAKLPGFDKYQYYTASVQSPSWEVLLLDELYRDVRGGVEPRTLREDFCGTFANCCAWVRLGPERRAVGVDLDPEPLAYGCAHYRERLKLLQQVRVQVVRENVLAPGLPTADVIAALNFSFFIFKSRPDLLAYFRNCQSSLEPDGLLVLDCFGGPADQKPHEETSNDEGYMYFFEQEGFDQLTHEALFHIHFQRKGEEKRLKAFTYDWRVWTIPELRDILLEAGFADVQIYWEAKSPYDDNEVEHKRVERVEKEPDSWTSYVVGLR